MEKQPLAGPPHDKPPPYEAASPSESTAWQPPPGYYPTSSPSQQLPNYGATQNESATIILPEILLVGACPACRVGVLEDDYTCLGIFCAIFCFPCGIPCCLLLKNRRCSNCGAYFG